MMTTLRTLMIVALVACASSKSNPDAGTFNPDGNANPLDAFGGSHFGDNCTTSSECAPDGYCVESSITKTCTYPCDQGCPDGWNCRVSDVAGQLVSLCMPQTYDFCKPCDDDAGCNGGVCVRLDDGDGYCLSQCPFEGPCPSGYTCNPDPTAAHEGNYCVPDTGSCTCTADQAGQVRTCQNTNSAGTCSGLETCMPDAGGWSSCTAPTATPETCDGMDNDCDQLIDDGVSGSVCDIANGAGTCKGVELCTGTMTLCQGPTPMTEKCNYTDDDCDTKVDETFTDVYPQATACSPGVGGCQRFGVMRCNANGDATECSVTPGTPLANELCNGLDDDCDMKTDEGIIDPTFGALGSTCNVGMGACSRTGNVVCNMSGGTQCSVTAGPTAPEACNLIDDNCNGSIDETFKNGSGVYNQNNHCGSCATDCTVLYNLPNATGVCTAGASTASCAMQCANNAFNLDGQASNGCELVLDPMAIYVSKSDQNGADDATCGLGPVGTGAGNYPCLTIAQGLARAVSTGRNTVRVANGIYPESVTLVNGKTMLGGHAPDNWQRNVSGTGTLITGVATLASTSHDYTVNASNISSTTLFEGFVIVGTINSKISGNSYGIYVANSSANLTIRANVIYGGRGGPGTSGGSGTPGAGGVDGTGRVSNPAAYDAKVTSGTAPCDAAANNRAYVNGGVRQCGADIVSGGNGGGNRCNPRPVYNAENSGIDGLVGQLGDPALGGAGGAGADSGDDGALLRQSGTDLCAVPTNPDYGRDGDPGKRAGHGASGAGCSMATGGIVSGHWVGGTAGAGANGGNGGGGGGGGAGGGSKCAAAGEFGTGTQACADGRDRLGGHGGGGGSGGCGGSGGTGATAGGGAFAIFIAGGTAPVVTNNSLIRGEGGIGGNGGAGGQGGPGGFGAAGGTSAVFCAGTAGRGGNGGDGGNGAGGGGGCGGASFGIFTSGIGTPNYCSGGAANTISSGSGGAGGSGGYSLINTGGNGAAGVLATCQFN